MLPSTPLESSSAFSQLVGAGIDRQSASRGKDQVCMQGASQSACPVFLLLTDDLEVHRAQLPAHRMAPSFYCSQSSKGPVALTCQTLQAPPNDESAANPADASSDNCHYTSQTIMWSSATRRIVIGCNAVEGSSQTSLLLFLTVTHQAQQIVLCSEASARGDVGCLLSPVMEVSLAGFAFTCCP